MNSIPTVTLEKLLVGVDVVRRGLRSNMAASDINTDSTLPTAVADESNTGSSPVVVETMEKMDKASEIAKLGSERLDYQVNSSPSRKTKKKASPKVAIISKYTSSIVEIIVGATGNQATFNVHKETFVKASPFFAAAFEGGFAESLSGALYLPEESPVVFTQVIDCIYNDSIPVDIKSCKDEDFLDGYPAFVRLFLAFDTYQLDKLQKMVTEIFGCLHHRLGWREKFSPALVSFAYSKTLEGSGLRMLVARMLAEAVCDRKELGGGDATFKASDFKGCFEEYPELAVQVTETLCETARMATESANMILMEFEDFKADMGIGSEYSM